MELLKQGVNIELGFPSSFRINGACVFNSLPSGIWSSNEFSELRSWLDAISCTKLLCLSVYSVFFNPELPCIVIVFCCCCFS